MQRVPASFELRRAALRLTYLPQHHSTTVPLAAEKIPEQQLVGHRKVLWVKFAFLRMALWSYVPHACF
jgi:hypothetical protein